MAQNEFVDLRITGNVTDPQEPLFLTSALQKYFKTYKKHTKPFLENIIVGNLRVSKIDHLGNTRAETRLRCALSDPENLEYGINIFQNT